MHAGTYLLSELERTSCDAGVNLVVNLKSYKLTECKFQNFQSLTFNIFLCLFRHKSASVIGLYNRPQRSTFDTDVTSPSHGRKVGHLISRDPDGSQVIELVKPPAGPFGFYIARGTYDFGSGNKHRKKGRKGRNWDDV